MKKLEINTAQNVIIEYQLASLGNRIGAFFIDAIIIGMIALLFHLIFLSSSSTTHTTAIIIPVLLYSIVSEIITNGQSLGKKAIGIKIIKINGTSLQAFDFLTRWIFGLIDIILSVGIVAIVMISSTSRAQCLGDLVGNMVVIQTNSGDIYSLNKILDRKINEQYTPVYPQANIYTEDEMLMIKQALNRYYKYKNAGHKEAILLLSKKIEEQLQITAPPNKITFLRQLLKDYIHLTR